MQQVEGVTEDLKAADQMAWVEAMNSVRSRVEEIILRGMIYGEDASMRILGEFWCGNIEPTEYDTSFVEYKKLHELIYRNEKSLKLP